MTATEARNLTDQCDWFREGNQTEPRLTERLDAAGCLFLLILPYTHVVPVLTCFFVVLTLFSILVNGFTLFGLRRSEDLSWEPRIAFLKNLIVSDLVQTFTFGPAVIHSLTQRRTMVFSTWCNIQYFVGITSVCSSLLTITSMALERYLYVCHAIHYLAILTQARLRLAVSLIWVYSLFIGTVCLVLLHIGKEQTNERFTSGLLCEPDMVEQHTGFPRGSVLFRKLTGCLTLLLCLVVYGFSYLRMYQDARNAVIPFNAVNNKARNTVVFYCCMLFLQLLPLLIKVISDMLWEFEGNMALMTLSSQYQDVHKAKKSPSTTAVLLHLSLLVMLTLPPCINPLLYGLRNVEMRQVLPNLLWWWPLRKGTGVRRVENIVHQNRPQAG
ncbi:olfactory receptor 2A12 [Mastacembelus armatus]|uniref:olfactory receptor 2A12 n=1 Tax=Mastacembelus armatus TaxID=205130 RepID=UPI000E464991|nr:olfactory receptor 2A12-like [Mastacembelus armatus]